MLLPSQRVRLKAMVQILSLLFLFILPYQNCAQMKSDSAAGSSTVDQSSSPTGGTPGTGTTVVDNVKPVFEVVPGDQVVLSGLMGRYSTTVNAQNISVKANPGVGAVITTIELGCKIYTAADMKTVHPDLEMLGCNTFVNGERKITIKPKDDRECLQTTAVVDLVVRKVKVESDHRQFKVTVNNACRPEQRILSADGERLDQLGTAVAISGNYAAVVASGDDGVNNTLNSAGALYIYNFNGTSWVQQQKIYASDAGANDTLSSVAISNGTIVAGAPYHQGKGAAYVFKLNGSSWVQTSKLMPASLVNADDFGTSVTVSDTAIAVGAPGDDTSGVDAGAVYVFNSDGSAKAKVLPPAGQHTAFGFSVAASGTRLLVGAPMALLYEGMGPGAAYIFDSASNYQTAKVMTLPTGVAAGAKFGFDVALSDTRAVVGASGGKVGGKATGQAFLYDASNPAVGQSLANGDLAEGDLFGSSVAVDGNTILVGAYLNNSRTGSAYVYTATDLTKPSLKLMARQRAANDQYASDVAVSGKAALIGGRLVSVSVYGTGAGYVVTLP